jgi:hypothetical protein
MSRDDWILFLHVLSAFALVTALVLYTFLILGGRSLAVPSEVVRLFRLARLGDVLGAAGSIGVLVFGVWLAIDVEGYHVWDGWIVAALVLWAVLGEVGRRTGDVYKAARDHARALVSESRDTPSPELNVLLRSQTGLVLHLVLVGVVLLLLVDMIFKPGA